MIGWDLLSGRWDSLVAMSGSDPLPGLGPAHDVEQAARDVVTTMNGDRKPSPVQIVAAAQFIAAARLMDTAVSRGDSVAARRCNATMVELYPVLGLSGDEEGALAKWLAAADAADAGPDEDATAPVRDTPQS